MTNSDSEKPDEKSAEQTEGISDDQLPEDLQPGEDNPLAEPLSEDDAPDDPASSTCTAARRPTSGTTSSSRTDPTPARHDRVRSAGRLALTG